MEVTVVADHTPGTAEVRQHAQPLAHLLAAPTDRLELGHVVRQIEEDRLDLLVDGRGEQPERLDRRLLGTEARVVRVGAENRVHAARSPHRDGACSR